MRLHMCLFWCVFGALIIYFFAPQSAIGEFLLFNELTATLQFYELKFYTWSDASLTLGEAEEGPGLCDKRASSCMLVLVSDS